MSEVPRGLATVDGAAGVMADRVRMNTLSLATTALAQTPSFWHAGADLLRSKSLDGNSYDSRDWFDRLSWTGTDNGFGHGLPLKGDNAAKWPLQKTLLANPALKPSAADVQKASAMAQELLRLRFSTPLCRPTGLTRSSRRRPGTPRPVRRRCRPGPWRCSSSADGSAGLVPGGSGSGPTPLLAQGGQVEPSPEDAERPAGHHRDRGRRRLR